MSMALLRLPSSANLSAQRNRPSYKTDLAQRPQGHTLRLPRRLATHEYAQQRLDRLCIAPDSYAAYDTDKRHSFQLAERITEGLIHGRTLDSLQRVS